MFVVKEFVYFASTIPSVNPDFWLKYQNLTLSSSLKMAEKTTEIQTTLVRYNNPVLVVKHEEKKDEEVKERPSSAGAIVDARKETEEILNSILPPRTWEEDGQLWTQTVSSTPATRQDVINLQEMLDTRLQQSQARETGICPVRRELYTQCFGRILLRNSFLTDF